MADAIRVLHVDDDPGFADVAAQFLERQDERITVVTEPSTADGLQQLADGEFDCVVSDYDMPDRNGIEFLEAVREECPGLPFILFTGKGGEAVAGDAISKGATDYLQKGGGPEQYELLANRVRNAVEQYRSTRRQRRSILTAFNQLPFGILVESPDREVLTANDRFCEFFDLPDPDAVIGRDCRRAAEEMKERFRDPDGFVARTDDLVGERREAHGDVLRTVDGRVFERSHLPVDLPMGDGSLWIYDDVTDGAERDRELQRYETVIEALGDPVYALDADGYYTFVNDAYTGETGYDREEIVGEHVSTVVPEEYVERGNEIIQQLLGADDRRSATWELERITADGERVPAENHLALLPADDGFQGTAGVIRDISERKRRERALATLHDATRELMVAETVQGICEVASETAVDVLELPVNGVHLYEETAEGLVPVAMSPANREIIGESPTIRPGEGLAWQVYETGDPQIHADVRRASGTYNPETSIRSELLLPLGEHGVFIASSTEVDDFEDGDVALAQVLAANVETALDRAQRQADLQRRTRELRRQNERLEEFASIISHDLQTPLNAAEGYLDLVRQECDSEHLDDVAGAIDRMGALIEDLLALAREGDRVSDLEAVDLASVVDRCWRTVAAAAATLVVDTDRTILADRGRLLQLLENLMGNAVEHGGEDVTITVGDLDDGAGFYVADDGPGVPPDERERVFDAGYSTTADGTGFGLSIVAEIAEAHGWDVAVTGGPDGGARFEITGIEPAS